MFCMRTGAGAVLPLLLLLRLLLPLAVCVARTIKVVSPSDARSSRAQPRASEALQRGTERNNRVFDIAAVQIQSSAPVVPPTLFESALGCGQVNCEALPCGVASFRPVPPPAVCNCTVKSAASRLISRPSLGVSGASKSSTSSKAMGSCPSEPGSHRLESLDLCLDR